MEHPTVSHDAAYPSPNEQFGLTKREYFAAMAMQGFIASYAGASIDPKISTCGEKSVEYADALIEALNKTQTNEASNSQSKNIKK